MEAVVAGARSDLEHLSLGLGESISRSLEQVTKGCGRSREKRRPYGQAEGSLRCRLTYARRPAAVTSTSPPVIRAVRRLFIHRLLRIFGGRGCNYLRARNANP